MQLVIANNTVAFGARDLPPGSGTPQYFTNGSPGVTVATQLPGWWLNQVQDELANLERSVGLSFNAADTTQTIQSILALRRFVDTGSVNALATSPQGGLSLPADILLPDGFTIDVTPAATSTSTTPTFAWSGGTVRTLVNVTGGALLAGDIVLNVPATITKTGGGTPQWSLRNPQASNGIVGRTQIFTTSGNFTVPNGVTSVEVPTCIGGAGAGGASADGSSGSLAGNAGGGGHGAGYSYRRITGLVPGTVIAVTVGAAGVAVANAAGGNGGTSSFGSYCSATGGGGGNWGTNTYGITGSPGSGIGGDLNISGANGGATGPNSASYNESFLYNLISRGGMSAGGFSEINCYGTGSVGLGFGGGGNGASGGSGVAGGNGSPGIVIVRW